MTNWLLALWNQVVEGSCERIPVGGLLSPRHLGPSDIDDYLTTEWASDAIDWRDAHMKGCDACLANVAAAATMHHLAQSLNCVLQWPRIGLSKARGATPYLGDGQTLDGSLRWTATEDACANCHIFLATDLMELENRRILVEAGRNELVGGQAAWKPVQWSAEPLLQAKALGAGQMQLGAEVVVTANERRRFPQDATLKLTVLDSAAKPVDPKRVNAVAEKLTGECLSRLTALVRSKVYGIPADLADELVQEFVAESFRGLARTYDPLKGPFWNFVSTSLCHFLGRSGKKVTLDATTHQGLDEAMKNGWGEAPELLAPSPEDDLARKEELALVRQLVASLPARERSLIGLRFDAELRIEEIAAATRYPEGSVRPWIGQAIRSIQIAINLGNPANQVAALRDVAANGRIYICSTVIERLADLLQSTQPELVLAAVEAVAVLGKKVRTKTIVASCQAVWQWSDASDDIRAAAGRALRALGESNGAHGALGIPSVGKSGSESRPAAGRSRRRWPSAMAPIAHSAARKS